MLFLNWFAQVGRRMNAGTALRRFWKMQATCLLFALIGVPLQAQAEVNLVFGTYAADKPTETVRKYKPFFDFLSSQMAEKLGEPVTIRLKVARSYSDGISQLTNGEVDFARLGPASYVLVKEQNPDIKIITMESKKGKKRFYGVIAVHSDSSYQSLADLAGRSFAFGSKLSTIGRYLAQASLLEAGISSKELDHYEFLGRHDLVGEAVGKQRFDAGALKEGTYDKLVAKGVPLKVLFKFENVTKPWLAHPTMPQHVLAAMREVMLAAHNEQAVLKIAKHGFLTGDDADYDFVRSGISRSRSF